LAVWVVARTWNPPVEMYRALCPLCDLYEDSPDRLAALRRISAHVAVAHNLDREPA
jgi:hypothetical protein